MQYPTPLFATIRRLDLIRLIFNRNREIRTSTTLFESPSQSNSIFCKSISRVNILSGCVIISCKRIIS